MAPESAARSARPGLSLYANLLDSSSDKDCAPGTISRAPVVFKQPTEEDPPLDKIAAEKQQISAASLRFQPTKRPQLSAQKSKTKSSTARPPTVAPLNPPSETVSSELVSVAGRPSAKTTLADWTAEGQDNDANEFYGGEKRQRGGRKKRKKVKEEIHALQNWDDIYDPSRPNNYEDYKHSDERIMEITEWKDKLYSHRSAKRHDSASNGARLRPRQCSRSSPREIDSSDDEHKPQLTKQFAPLGISFAPPQSFDDDRKLEYHPPLAEAPNSSIVDEVFAQKVRLSQFRSPKELIHCRLQAHEVKPLSDKPLPPLSSPTTDPPLPLTVPPLPLTVPQPPTPLASISRAPVRYNLPAAPSEIPSSEAELEDVLRTVLKEEGQPSDVAPRSLRPGQKGFAERLMSKYGWSKGSGLGASGSGIVNPLRVQIEKQKKKPDSEGGGIVGPGGRGKIIGGKKKASLEADSEDGKFGVMSEVVVLRGMVDGMDLAAEMEAAGDGGLVQEIGEECGDKYGRVERVFIDRSDASRAPVFIKFTSQSSALRAVNALEGRIFNGNVISARFFDDEKFEKGIYV